MNTLRERGFILDSASQKGIYTTQGKVYIFEPQNYSFSEPLSGYEIGVNPVIMIHDVDEGYLVVLNADSPEP